MKISLSGGMQQGNDKLAEKKLLARDIAACKRGDWEARKRLARTFAPLIHSLAEKRAGADKHEVNRRIELGRQGLDQAARKFKASMDASRFKIFALSYIEKAMDAEPSKSWFGRILTRK